MHYNFDILIKFFPFFQLRGDFNQLNCDWQRDWWLMVGREFSVWRVLGGNFSL